VIHPAQNAHIENDGNIAVQGMSAFAWQFRFYRIGCHDLAAKEAEYFMEDMEELMRRGVKW